MIWADVGVHDVVQIVVTDRSGAAICNNPLDISVKTARVPTRAVGYPAEAVDCFDLGIAEAAIDKLADDEAVAVAAP